jgi:hypothetical protein
MRVNTTKAKDWARSQGGKRLLIGLAFVVTYGLGHDAGLADAPPAQVPNCPTEDSCVTRYDPETSQFYVMPVVP